MTLKFKWSRWLQWGLLIFIVYQVAFTWAPLWMGAREKAGLDVSQFAIENEAGDPVYLSDFKGKPLVINFWASWCLPCRLELPLLNQVYPRLSEKGTQLIAVNFSEPWTTIRRFRQKTAIAFPVFKDDGTLAQQLGISVIPSIVVIDQTGKVASITFGFRPWVQAYLLWWV